MPDRKVTAKEIIEDINKGLTDSALIEKYKISSRSLQGVFNQLIDKGLIKKEDFEKRSQSFVCPACNRSANKQFEECPHCGVIVSKFNSKKSKESNKTNTNTNTSSYLSESENSNHINSKELDSTNHQYKNCPYCGEQILFIAKKCKHCGEFFEQQNNMQLQEKVVKQEKVLSKDYPKGKFICNNCGNIGNPKNRNKGSILVCLVLFLFFIIPGFIYLVWMLANPIKICKKCDGVNTVILIKTPAGQKLVKEYYN